MKNQLLVLILCLLLVQITPFQNKLKISNDFIDLFEQVKNEELFNITAMRDAIQYVDDKTMETRVKNNAYNGYMGEILNEYAKKLFYGKLNNGNPQIQKAFLFFKLAAKYGNAESLYYLSFYSFYNLDGRFLFKDSYEKLEESDKHVNIRNFIKNMNTTTLMNTAQHSSQQGYAPAKYLLGNLHLRGRGVPANCAKAGYYFKDLGSKLFSEGLIPEVTTFLDVSEKKRLDDLYFSLEPEHSVLPLKDNLQQQQYLAMSADLGDVNTMMELGFTYYNGLKGEKRNFQKAFEYFRKAAARGNLEAMVQVGSMLTKGLGVEKDVKSGIKYLEEAANKGDPRAKNVLGELYKIGEGVSMNQTIALNYFKEAAEANYSAALYNYGASLMTQDPSQAQQAFSLVGSAAEQGHPMAIFHTGFQYFHSNQVQNGCEIGAALMKVGLESGPWSEKLKEGYYAYQKKLYKLAALHYMEAALLGSDIGAVNAALIIDEFKVFDDYDLTVMQLEQEMSIDPIWKELASTYSYRPPKDIQHFLHEDLITVLSNLKYPETKTGVILQTLSQSSSQLSSRYRQHLVLKLLKLGAEEHEPLSLAVLGDSYQTGKHGEKDLKKAYEQYSEIVSIITPSYTPTILSHTLYNLGYMNHHGLGTSKNLTQAIEYYNMTTRFDKKTPYLTLVNKKLAEWEKEVYGDEIPNALGSEENVEVDQIGLIKGVIRNFEERYIKKIMLGFLMFGALVLYLAKMRLQNYMSMSMSEQRAR